MFSTLSLKEVEYEPKYEVPASRDLQSAPQERSTYVVPPPLSKSHDSPDVERHQPSRSRRSSDNLENVEPTQPSEHRHRSIDDSDTDPLQPSDPLPTSKESANVQPAPTSKRPCTTDDLSLPGISKRHRGPARRPPWNTREDEVMKNCIARGEKLATAVAELKTRRCGPARSYEACRGRWYRHMRLRTNERRENHEHDSDHAPNDVLAQSDLPKSRGRRGNFTRAWHPREEEILILRYTGVDTDWEVVAAEINRLGCIPTPRTPVSCKVRWARRFRAQYDVDANDSDEDDDHTLQDDTEKHDDNAQHHERAQPIRPRLPRTLTRLGKNPIQLLAATFQPTAGVPECEQIEPCIVVRDPNHPVRNDERTFPVLAERELHLQTPTCGPEPRARPLGADPRPSTCQADINTASRNLNTQPELRTANELSQQDVALPYADKPPPRPQLSAGCLGTNTERRVSETEATHSGLLSMAELAHNENPLPRGAAQGPPVAGLCADGPRPIDPIMLEMAAKESNSIAPSTFLLVYRAVARNVQRIQGEAAGSEAELMDEVAKDLGEGWHMSTVIAVRYKTLTGDDIEPELVEKALRDIEAVQHGTSDHWLHLCAWILQANISPELAEGEKSMGDDEKLENRVKEVRAGKDKWGCVAALYHQLCRERR